MEDVFSIAKYVAIEMTTERGFEFPNSPKNSAITGTDLTKLLAPAVSQKNTLRRLRVI
jgi:hypothetical protein